MIRTVFSATINYDHPQRGMETALRGIFGQDRVHTFDYYQRLMKLGNQNKFKPTVNGEFLRAAVAAKPDWVWLQLQDTEIITADTLAKLRQALPKAVITHWTGDCRPQVSAYLSSICKATDITLVSSTGQLPMFRAAGAPRAEYCQIGLDFEEDVLGIPDWTPPFRVPAAVFIGNYYEKAFQKGTEERRVAIEALVKAGIDVGVVGTGWPKGIPVAGRCGVKQQHHVWKRAKVCLNINHFNDIERYYSDRQLIAMASGRPVVCARVPGLEEEFRDGRECRMFPSLMTPPESANAQLVEFVKGLLDNPERSNQMGHAGRLCVVSKHTWFNRFTELLPVIEELRKAKERLQ